MSAFLIFSRCWQTFRQIKLPNPLNWTLTGFSNAGGATTMCLLEPRIMLDSGINIINNGQTVVPDLLMITHSHKDHSRYLYHYVKMNKKVNGGLKVITQRDNFYDISIRGLNKENYYAVDRTRNKIRFPMLPTLSEKKGPVLNESILDIEVFPLRHRVPSVGYGISVNFEKQVLMMGDTTVDPLYFNNGWNNYPVVVIECTNYSSNRDNILGYRAGGHINWVDLEPIIRKNRDVYFCLIHSNSLIKSNMINHMNQILLKDKGLKNVFLWIDDRLESVQPPRLKVCQMYERY